MLAVRPLAAPRSAPLSARCAVRGRAAALLRRPSRPSAAPRAAFSVSADASAALSALSPVLLGIEDAFFGSPLKLAGTVGISFVTFRVILYFSLQNILARHLQNNVPAGARVVHYGIKNGLHLNYYKPGIKLVHGVDPEANDGVLFTVGGQAGIPVTAQKAAYTARLNLEAGSMDSAVTIDALGQQSADAVDASLAECARVLRPGAPLVFFEHGSGGEALISALERSALFDRVIADKQWATYALAKHSIGLAFRTGAQLAGAAAGEALSGRAAATASYMAKMQQAKVQAVLGGKMPVFDEDEEDGGEAPAGDAPAAPQPPPPPRRQGRRKEAKRR